MATIVMKEINVETWSMRIVGTSPLIQHAWSEKMAAQLGGMSGSKTKNRDERVPEQECHDAAYWTSDGEPGVPLMAIKGALISAAHKDIGFEKTLLRKSIFFPCSAPDKIVPLDAEPYKMRDDIVRVGMNKPDRRFRPEYAEWAVDLVVQIDADLVTIENIINLCNRAGFGVGIGEWRPEKGGEYGRFKVDTDSTPKLLAKGQDAA